MASVTFSVGVGGDGSTVTDDSNASTGLANGGHRTRFVPALAQVVAVAGHVVTKAGEADSDASAAAVSQTAAATSASNALASENAAASIAAGVLATSTTSLTVGTGSKSLTVQTGKQFASGQFCTIASVADPANYMWGQVTGYTSGTGALIVNVTTTGGSGTIASWNVSVSGSRGATGPTGPSGVSNVRYSARTSNTILSTADQGYLIDVTSGTFTQTFDAAVTLGAGWWCYYKNSGSGDVTLDPNGAETIDGLANFIAYTGELRIITCDGSNLYSFVLNPFYRVFTASGTFTKPPGYQAYGGLLWGGGASGARNTSLDCGCGGGGGCTPFSLVASAVGTTETVTIAATTAGRGTNGAGTAGGNSTFGSLATGYGGGAGGYNAGAFYGGGGGGGVLGVGGTGQASGNFGSGGLPYNTATSTTLDSHFGGGAGVMSGNSGGNAAYGGGGGGASGVAGGKSLYGGGGGGNAIGTSLYGGSGGIARGGAGATNAGNGVAPGGGGGGVGNGTGTSGDGARGELRIWGVV